VVVRAITFDATAPFLQVDTPVNGLLTNHINVTCRPDGAATRADGQRLAGVVNPIDGTFAAASRTGRPV